MRPVTGRSLLTCSGLLLGPLTMATCLDDRIRLNPSSPTADPRLYAPRLISWIAPCKKRRRSGGLAPPKRSRGRGVGRSNASQIACSPCMHDQKTCVSYVGPACEDDGIWSQRYQYVFL